MRTRSELAGAKKKEF
jgi:hypothetical protein